MDAASLLVKDGKIRHGLFFAHLAIEKAIKAIYTERLAKVPPKTHNLETLIKLAGISITQEHVEKIRLVNTFNIEGRYPDEGPPTPQAEEAAQYLNEAREIYAWLTRL